MKILEEGTLNLWRTPCFLEQAINLPTTLWTHGLMLNWFLTCLSQLIHKTIPKVTRYFLRVFLSILSVFHPHKLHLPKLLRLSSTPYPSRSMCKSWRWFALLVFTPRISSFQFINASNIKHSYHPQKSVWTKFFCLEPL